MIVAAFPSRLSRYTFSITTFTGSFWLALLLAPPLVAACGLVIERMSFRRLYAAGHISQLLLTIGIAHVIAEATKIVWGDNALTVQPPPSLAGHVVILGATIPVYHLFIVATAAVLIGGLALLIVRTRLGMVVRAAAVYPDMVEALGFKVNQIHALVFLIGVYLAAVAGVVMTPMVGAYPGMADDALV